MNLIFISFDREKKTFDFFIDFSIFHLEKNEKSANSFDRINQSINLYSNVVQLNRRCREFPGHKNQNSNLFELVVMTATITTTIIVLMMSTNTVVIHSQSCLLYIFFHRHTQKKNVCIPCESVCL